MSTTTHKPVGAGVWTLFAFWTLAVTAGAVALLNHSFDGEQTMHAPSAWPEVLGTFNPEGDALTIVMAAHPQCSCTRASLAQLERLLARFPQQMHALVCVYQMPGQKAQAVQQSAFWKHLEALPGVEPKLDPEGTITALLGAEVSGSVAAFNRTGTLVFQGGLTASRGHEGPSLAIDHLAQLASGHVPEKGAVASAPVFGCRFESASAEGGRL